MSGLARQGAKYNSSQGPQPDGGRNEKKTTARTSNDDVEEAALQLLRLQLLPGTADGENAPPSSNESTENIIDTTAAVVGDDTMEQPNGGE